MQHNDFHISQRLESGQLDFVLEEVFKNQEKKKVIAFPEPNTFLS